MSYKPQKISPSSQCTVGQLLHERIRDSYMHPQFTADVMRPLMIDKLMDQEVSIFNCNSLPSSSFDPRYKTCLVVSCNASPLPCASASRPTST